MADKKKHHYVPISYLKRFSEDSIHVYVKLNSEIRKIPFSSQNQKNYLYSLDKKIFGNKFNLLEDFLGQKVETPYNVDMMATIDKDIIPEDDKLLYIVYFAIIQSCRPLVYKDFFDVTFKENNIKISNNEVFTNFGVLVLSMINKFWEKTKTCSVEILIADSKAKFITSDNPSTLWITSNGEKEFIPMTLKPIHDNNPTLELMMSLNSKYLIKVFLNKSRPVSATKWNSNTRILSFDETVELNKRIAKTKYKSIYSIRELELVEIK